VLKVKGTQVNTPYPNLSPQAGRYRPRSTYPEGMESWVDL